MRIPDYLEPLIAWRGWRVGEDGGLYGPTASAALWIPGEPCRALCGLHAPGQAGNRYLGEGRKHPIWTAPQPRCTCGFYCYKNLSIELLSMLDGFTHYNQACFGQVKIWGRVIEHEDGYRAQYAYPKAVIVGADAVCQRQIETIRKEYRIEVETVPNIVQWVQETIRQLHKV